ncbi:hybrid sensor histidine kinase/response regulator [Candidatus Magnetominusculus xianensis]|uniref:histidine kinase n=1 Tax=Candidatus Magnetominusculus xianensis TaxID=1748249 RepID=A0ABR5SCX5_9BACT|nr:response regulator [Candidatus Magnetominusculus xianensis]KWT82510.1 PAS domain-containing two-component system sensor histidine kinase/response [Candidatus Magnetominusculus xianensis]MBF0405410.1 response regulator [Nitrospirota bacterium]
MSKKKVLIVEDEIIIAKDIQKCVEDLGYVVTGAVPTAREAFMKIEQRRPDLVLMDIMLQDGIDGVEAASQIRKKYDIPVIYLTAYADEKMIERAKITEPFGYLLKPFEDKELHINIEMAMYKHKLEKCLRESHQWLSTTINSIGDGVIATELTGRVIFINETAKSMTGWEGDSAIGRSANDIFNVTLGSKGSAKGDRFNLEKLSHKSVTALDNPVLTGLHGRQYHISGCTAAITDDLGVCYGKVIAFHDITERLQAEEAFNAQREKFISVLIHDLKTPLLAIKGYTRRYLAGKAATEEAKNEILHIIENAAADLLQIIEETSKSLKEKASLGKFNPVNVDFASIVSLVLRNCLPMVDSRGLTITINGMTPGDYQPQEDLTLTADPYQLKSMVENILSNAAKYARTSIKVEVSGDSSSIRFSVSDDGQGICPQYHDKIFDVYFQVPGSMKGTGLGLYSVKKAVTDHYGEIKLYSTVGSGTRFEIKLPRTPK